MTKPNLITLFVLTTLASWSVAQTSDPEGFKKRTESKPVKADAKADQPPVTRAEAIAVFTRAHSICASALKKKGLKFVAPFPKDNQPLTREQALNAIKQFVKDFSGDFTHKTRPKRFDAKRLKVGANSAEIQNLIRDGFVAPYGPLTTGTKDTLQLREFGDAIGIMILNIAELTQMPSQEYTPALMKGRG